mmetsp:Transcript_39465/g.91128  ORF Transcript_39465/g.91128 Transcript_39465/m.91128 type:complete len:245 (-) Transcript_39465:116-850(-)
MDEVKVLNVRRPVLARDSVIEGGDIRLRINEESQEFSLVHRCACLCGAHHWCCSGCDTWRQRKLSVWSRLELVLDCCFSCCGWSWLGWSWRGRSCGWSWRGRRRSWSCGWQCNLKWRFSCASDRRTSVSTQQRRGKTPALLHLKRALVAICLHFLKLLVRKICVAVMNVHELIRAWQRCFHIEPVVLRRARPRLWDLVHNESHVGGVNRNFFALIHHSHVGLTWVGTQVPNIPHAIQLLHRLHL